MKTQRTKLLLTTILLGLCLAGAAKAADASSGHEKTAQAPAAAAHSFKNVNVEEYEKLRQDKSSVVLDVRTPKEFAGGHIPGAINIDIGAPDFDKKVATLDPKKTYLVNCAGGVRSAKACSRLSQLNFGTLYNLEGGMKAWEKSGHTPAK
jgi:rhodanese-related sulfurtransferase